MAAQKRPSKRSHEGMPSDILALDELVEFFTKCRQALGEEPVIAAPARRSKQVVVVEQEPHEKATPLPVTRSRGRPQKRNLPPNILRVDRAKAHGYWVRFQRDGNKQTKLFSDSVYGGWQAALAAATVWRNETAAQLPSKSRVPKPSRELKRAHEKASKKGTPPPPQRMAQQLLPYDQPAALSPPVVSTAALSPAVPSTVATVRKPKAKPALEVTPPPPPPPSPPPLPVSRFRYDCGRCGGHIERVTGPGRNYKTASGALLAIPDDVSTKTCQKCGEHYLSASEAVALEAMLQLGTTPLNGLVTAPTARRRVMATALDP